MSDDIPQILSRIHGVEFPYIDDEQLKGGVLYELQAALGHHGKSLTDFGISAPPDDLLHVLRN